MSRIGNKVVVLPAGVTVEQNGATVTVKGPKGELTRTFAEAITMEINGSEVTFKRPDDSKEMKTIHGTTRANFNNMVVGVSEGFRKELEMIGVGYRAQLFKVQNLYWLLVNLTQTKSKLQQESLSKFQMLHTSTFQVQIKKLLVKQLLTSVAVVHQNLIKVKVFVTLANSYVVKKVKLVNNLFEIMIRHLVNVSLPKFCTDRNFPLAFFARKSMAETIEI